MRWSTRLVPPSGQNVSTRNDMTTSHTKGLPVVTGVTERLCTAKRRMFFSAANAVSSASFVCMNCPCAGPIHMTSSWQASRNGWMLLS